MLQLWPHAGSGGAWDTESNVPNGHVAVKKDLNEAMAFLLAQQTRKNTCNLGWFKMSLFIYLFIYFPT